jgi:hypothetical protein
MTFHLDEHVDPAVARGLARRGIDASTSRGAGLIKASDVEQLAFAHAEGRVIVTNDPDFLRLHQEGADHSGIAYYVDQRQPVGELIRKLELLHEVIPADEMRGCVEFL